MNARKTVINRIQASIDTLKPQEHNKYIRAVLNLPEILLPRLDGLPALEAFLSPPPDIDAEGEHCFGHHQHAQGILLGVYYRMGHSGTLGLYEENLEQFFWRILLEINAQFSHWRWSYADLKELSVWVVEKTYWHERFHHSMDVLRHLFNVNSFNTFNEEALAVAYSRYHLTHHYRRWPEEDQQVLWDAFLALVYRYSSPGYSEWRQFADESSLKSGICEYLNLPATTYLNTARVSVTDMLFDLIPVKTGFIEKVL